MRSTSLIVALSLVLLAGSASAVDPTKYAWEAPVVTNISPAADYLKQQLAEQVADILKAGNLAPWRVSHADQETNAESSYFVYMEQGRIVTTLAWAYPHLPAAQQQAVKTYVAGQMANSTFAPWATSRLTGSVTATRREFHQLTKVWNDWGTSWQGKLPTVQTLYGCWLWAYRANDWATIQTYWPQIKTAYNAKADQGNIYGTMGAHIAMIRLADHFGDTAMRDTALANLTTNLNAGLDFAATETKTQAMYDKMYDSRQNGSIYRGWMFLNLCPEIGRYIADNATLKTAALARHNSGKSSFPLWWLVDAPYFQRSYTGDEGVGLIAPDMMGQIVPMERWVVGASGATMIGYMRSAPSCRGDCVWIESLVQAIEANGTLQWVNVQALRTAPMLAVPSVAPTTVTPRRPVPTIVPRPRPTNPRHPVPPSVIRSTEAR